MNKVFVAVSENVFSLHLGNQPTDTSDGGAIGEIAAAIEELKHKYPKKRFQFVPARYYTYSSEYGSAIIADMIAIME